MKHTYWNISYTYNDGIGQQRYGSDSLRTDTPFFNMEGFKFIQTKVGRSNVVFLSVSNLGQMTKEEWEGIDEQSK